MKYSFEYAALDVQSIPAPYIEIEIESPAGRLMYICLVDSGATYSSFPEEAIEEFGLDRSQLTPVDIGTAAHPRPALHLQATGVVNVALDDTHLIPLAPQFLRDFDEHGDPYRSHESILGRDFFLGAKVTFDQGRERIDVEL